VITPLPRDGGRVLFDRLEQTEKKPTM
jgi:hypothetical protein